jgi:NAD(P)-dependent dehydrogenase (short-subunit alcohol dehydrogenase family)
MAAFALAAGALTMGTAGVQALAAQTGDQAQKAVLVTGASSGIGRRITEVLAAKGYFVYAGARSAEDLKALDAIDNVQSIRLDVTRQNEIDAAVETVRAGGRGLYGVVNNAGVAVLAPMIEAVEEDLLFQFNVNVLGPYRITKAFAPLILESKGRITTIGSINGIIAGPFSGPYAMSKHAMEAFTDALALEMAPFGVKVSIVEPGRFQSEMSINVLQRMQEKGRTAEGSRYEAQLQAMIDSFGVDESTHKDPLDVAQAVEHALFDPNPKLRYLVAPVAAQAHAAVRRAMEKAVELNERQVFSLDRAALIAMLDAAIAR